MPSAGLDHVKVTAFGTTLIATFVRLPRLPIPGTVAVALRKVSPAHTASPVAYVPTVGPKPCQPSLSSIL